MAPALDSSFLQSEIGVASTHLETTKNKTNAFITIFQLKKLVSFRSFVYSQKKQKQKKESHNFHYSSFLQERGRCLLPPMREDDSLHSAPNRDRKNMSKAIKKKSQSRTIFYTKERRKNTEKKEKSFFIHFLKSYIYDLYMGKTEVQNNKHRFP